MEKHGLTDKTKNPFLLVEGVSLPKPKPVPKLS